MQFSRAAFLSSDGTTHQGACLMSVYWKVVSFAIEYFMYSSCSARSMSDELPPLERLRVTGLEALGAAPRS